MYEQQWRYFYKVAGIDDPHPIELFNKHLFALIKECRLINEQVVLMINANKDVYKRKFAKAIARQGVDLESAYDRVHEERMPSSHISGSKALMRFFVLSGIDCTKAFIGRFNLGVGNHRGPHIISLTTESVLGTTDPSPTSRTGRNVQAKIPRTRTQYNGSLKQNCKRHNMLSKMTKLLKRQDKIVDEEDSSPKKADLKRRIGKWDKEHIQFETGAEKKCCKKKMGKIPYSPEVGEWIKRRNVLRWLKRYHASRQRGLQSKIKMKSLKKSCHSSNLPLPRRTTLDGVLLEIHICNTKLKELEHKAPKVQKSFMLNRLTYHKDQDNAKSRKEVQRIIVNESKKEWKQICSTLGKARSLPASKVETISADGGHVVHSEKVNIHLALKEHLGNRFQTARNSPIIKRQIFQDLGHLANIDVADDILRGRYKYSTDTKEDTELLLQEATRLPTTF